MADIPPPLPSPGLAARRKNRKSLPRLPLSAFTPPNTGTSDRFPLLPSPSTVHPQSVIDGNVEDLAKWEEGSGSVLATKAREAVVTVQSVENEDSIQKILGRQSSLKPVGLIVPLALENGAPSTFPSYVTKAGTGKVSLSTALKNTTPKHADGIKWALQNGYVVDLDAYGVGQDESSWETLEELLEKALGTPEERKSTIVLSSVLPSPISLDIPIVKLLSHPSYISYQKHIATISLFPNVHVKFLPPSWNEAVPDTTSEDRKKKNEWVRRVKMYLGPAVEAFGYQRIIFGSSPSPNSAVESKSGDWYEVARQSLAELGIEQEDIDAVFSNNARNLYCSNSV